MRLSGQQPLARWRSSAGCRRRRRRPGSRARGGRPRRASKTPADGGGLGGARRSGPSGLKRSITGSETLCLPSSSRNRPSVLRSSGTRPMPILGADRVGGRAERHRPAVDAERSPCAELGHAEAGEEQVLLAHALQAGDAEDLALRGASKLAPASLPPAARSRTPRTGARRLSAGGGARRKGLARCERPMIISITSASRDRGDRAGARCGGRCAGWSAGRRRRAPRACGAR